MERRTTVKTADKTANQRKVEDNSECNTAKIKALESVRAKLKKRKK